MAAHAPQRTLVLGAASSGKSAAAEDLLAAEPAVLYAATGPQPDPADPGWAGRVSAHRERRPVWWATDESGDLVSLLATPGAPLLVDSLGTWLAAAMERCGAWEAGEGDAWRERLDREVEAVVRAWRQTARRVVAVGEEVGWGVVPPTTAGIRFREALGGLTRRLALETERVVLVVAGRSLELSPDLTPAHG